MRFRELVVAVFFPAVVGAGTPLLYAFDMNTPANQENKPGWMEAAVAKLERELVAQGGEDVRTRVQRGLGQVASFWRAGDGTQAEFEEFVRRNFAADQKIRDTMFERFDRLFEQLDGHLQEIGREFRTQADLDIGPILPFDEMFAGYNAGAHVTDDFFGNKIAFVVLLNFPLTTLEQRLREGEQWTRRQWAEARLAQRFAKRVPASVNLAIAGAAAEADRYIAEYNIWMHHLINKNGNRLFPPKLRLLSHWNLRDQIKAEYSEPEHGLEKQRMIQTVMERIVLQTIPASVVNNPYVDWNPFTNEVTASTVRDAGEPPSAMAAPSSAPEPDTRYSVLLKTFLASRQLDPYSPTAPTLIARRFEEDREIPEARVRSMLEEVVASPVTAKVAALIQQRLNRPLEPFDIWYNGFRPRAKFTEAQLDDIVAKKYPTAHAYAEDMPNLLVQLGFDRERAAALAKNIVVEPARGSGHAMGAAMRSSKTRLRTRVEKEGMNYKGFNIAVHEMGHNVEQTISLNEVDYTSLQGVPNTAFTEALAFVFQAEDLRLLGLATPDEKAEPMRTLDDFWGTYEIAGVALVDMAIWHWMYDHPAATAAELRGATVDIARGIWNRYYAPVFKLRDVVLLGIYSHMIHSFLYLPDYPLGQMIARQITERIRKGGIIGPEFERMAKLGRIAPDLWMKQATGSRVGPEALLDGVERALRP